MRRESARKRPKPTTAPAVRGGGGGEKSWRVRTVAVDGEASAEETETEDDDEDEGEEEKDGIGVSKARVLTCESYDAYLRSKPESRKRRWREMETPRVGERRSRDPDGNVCGDGGEGSPRKAWYHTGPRDRIVAPTGEIATQKPKHALDALATTAFTKAAGTMEQDAGDQLCAVCDTRSTPQWRIFPKRFVAPRTCDSGSVVCNKCYAKAKRAAAIRTRDAAG